MYNRVSQSIMDYLMLVIKDLPGMDGFKMHVQRKPSDPMAKKLYSLWSDSSNKISSRKMRRPLDLSDADIRGMESAGVIQVQGNDLKVTAKGEKLLLQMILDDDSFALKKANNQGLIKTASVEKKAITLNWYRRIRNENIDA